MCDVRALCAENRYSELEQQQSHKFISIGAYSFRYQLKSCTSISDTVVISLDYLLFSVMCSKIASITSDNAHEELKQGQKQSESSPRSLLLDSDNKSIFTSDLLLASLAILNSIYTTPSIISTIPISTTFLHFTDSINLQ